jgi:hypothetical protein
LKKLKLSFGGKSFYAKLLYDDAPRTVREILEACPFESRLSHAKICDNEFFFQAPINIDEMENPVYSEVGHMAFFNIRQTVCVWYSNTVPLGNCDLFALIEEGDLPRLAEEASKIWDKQGGLVKVEAIEVQS